MRNLLVFGARMQAIDAGEIDQEDFLLALELRLAHAVFNGNTGKISHLLAEAGKPVKERGFAGIRRPDNGHNNRPFSGRTGRLDRRIG